MAEVLVDYDTILTTSDGHKYRPHACGRVMDGGLWEGWIEFIPVTGARTGTGTGAPERSARETEQPNRADLLYWAQGLSQIYLEGALSRALLPLAPGLTASPMESAFDNPQPRARTTPEAPVPRPVLDPFEVYAQGAAVLRRQLGALDPGHLRQIVRAYDLAPIGTVTVAQREELTAIIMTAVSASAEEG